MRNADCRTWTVAGTMKIMENEKIILQELECDKKHQKREKMRNAHCRSWRMARKLKIMEIDKHTRNDLEYWEKHSKT